VSSLLNGESKHSSNPQLAKYILVGPELPPSQRSPRQGREAQLQVEGPSPLQSLSPATGTHWHCQWQPELALALAVPVVLPVYLLVLVLVVPIVPSATGSVPLAVCHWLCATGSVLLALALRLAPALPVALPPSSAASALT
jgi:hypothetical protein